MAGRRITLLMAIAVLLCRTGARAQQCEYPVIDLEVCPPCPSSTPLCRRAHPGFQPDINGCGPKKFQKLIDNGVIPQGYGTADFRNGGCDSSITCGCNQHDKCYDTCNADKAACDKAFLDELLRECARKYPVDPRGRAGCPDGLCFSDNERLGICKGRAKLYYDAVAGGGQGPYEESQQESCECCCNLEHAYRPVPGVQPQGAPVCQPPIWVGTATAVIGSSTIGGYSTSATITWKVDDERTVFPTVTYYAEGTVEVTNTTLLEHGCTVTPTQFALTQAMRDENSLIVGYEVGSTPGYTGTGLLFGQITITCPDQPAPETITTGYSWFSGGGSLSPDGRLMEGTTTTDLGKCSYSFQAQ